MEEVSVFYSWQTDLPNKTNRQAIKAALSLAVPEIESKYNVNIKIDEATRDEAGSPNIPETIIKKIKNSDIFVGDVSTINKSCACDLRKTPNPNVVFELGYAVAHLGWNRILLMVNTGYSDIKLDLPFDFDRHRVSPYCIDTENKDKKNLQLKN